MGDGNVLKPTTGTGDDRGRAVELDEPHVTPLERDRSR